MGEENPALPRLHGFASRMGWRPPLVEPALRETVAPIARRRNDQARHRSTVGSDRLHMARSDRMAQRASGKRAIESCDVGAGSRSAGRRRAFRTLACLACRRSARILDFGAARREYTPVCAVTLTYARYHPVTVTSVTR